MVLTSRYVGGDGETPFAIATVVSVRPTTVQEMMREPRLCSMDGFESPAVWHGHFRTRYPGIGDAARLMRLQLRIDEMDKDVAERLMGGSAAEPEHERVFVD